MKRKLFIMRKTSKSGNDYFILGADLGYRTITLSYDLGIVVELSGKSYEDVMNFNVDEIIYIGEF